MDGKKKNTRYEIRFSTPEHYETVCEAARDAGLSINQWLVLNTLKAARIQLAESRKLLA